MAGRTALLAAGGTGGHLFPAEALAHELIARGWSVHLATDERAGRFTGTFPASVIHPLPSATIAGRNPVALAGAFWKIWRGVRADSRGAGAEPSRETATKRQAERNAETTTVRSRANAGGTATLPPPAGANGSNGSDHPHNDEHSSDQQDQSN